MKLLGSRPSPLTCKARIVLAEKKIDYEFVVASPWDDGPRVTACNPLGKVPVLLLEDETCLYDSRVIVEFLDNVSPIGRLIPSGNRERSEVRRWEALADIAVGVCLDYLDFRYPKLLWHDTHPNLARLQARLAERQSFIDTAPKD